MKNLKKLTLLHSNDMHGDFSSEKIGSELVGGLSLLSGYIKQVRQEEENVLYSISGDMFQGSLIDTEYRGVSTIELMNLLLPDVVTLGNHEVDYGLAHLLFLEKCARFPIINANMYIKMSHKRLFNSHIVLETGGMRILFIGILTEQVLDKTRTENIIGTMVDVSDAVEEVGRICDSYRTTDIDFTVLLTHIGFEEDKQLAARLRPEWGVDIIIGGHSHTKLDEPAVVGGIPIVQAAIGTDQIGRFDIMVDTDNNCIDSYSWQLVPIDDEHCQRDQELECVLDAYERKTDNKYGRMLTHFAKKYTHPHRNRETELGKIITDAYQEMLGVDIMLTASGGIRSEHMGPLVTYRDLVECCSFDEPLFGFKVTGAQLKSMMLLMMRNSDDEEHNEFYQISKGLYIKYDRQEKRLLSLQFQGRDVQDSELFSLAMHQYHYLSIESFLGVSHKELEANGKPHVIATSSQGVLEEYFLGHALVKCPAGARIEYGE